MATATTNARQFADDIAEEFELPKTHARKIVAYLFGEMQARLNKGETVSIPGFGKFHVAERKARTARNPRTGETVKLKATKTPRFRPAKALKDGVAAGRKSRKK